MALRRGREGSTLPTMVPEVRYVRSGEVAYQVVGEGPFGPVWTRGAA